MCEKGKGESEEKGERKKEEEKERRKGGDEGIGCVCFPVVVFLRRGSDGTYFGQMRGFV
jgi:hypothetical protein